MPKFWLSYYWIYMKRGLFEVVLSVFFYRPSLLSSNGGRLQAWSSEYKLVKLILQVGSAFYHLTSHRKSAPVQRSSGEIPKAFNQHDIAGKTIKYLGVNALIYQNDKLCFRIPSQSYPHKLLSFMGRGIPHSDDNKISIPFQSFMITVIRHS